MRIIERIILTTVLALCSTMMVNAQVMKSADLEKYAKERYGDR